MSRHSGRYKRGDHLNVRAVKRDQAEQRNGRTPTERTAKFRRDRATIRAVVDALNPPAPGGEA